MRVFSISRMLVDAEERVGISGILILTFDLVSNKKKKERKKANLTKIVSHMQLL